MGAVIEHRRVREEEMEAVIEHRRVREDLLVDLCDRFVVRCNSD
jgi:hypothetical protein